MASRRSRTSASSEHHAGTSGKTPHPPRPASAQPRPRAGAIDGKLATAVCTPRTAVSQISHSAPLMRCGGSADDDRDTLDSYTAPSTSRHAKPSTPSSMSPASSNASCSMTDAALPTTSATARTPQHREAPVHAAARSARAHAIQRASAVQVRSCSTPSSILLRTGVIMTPSRATNADVKSRQPSRAPSSRVANPPSRSQLPSQPSPEALPTQHAAPAPTQHAAPPRDVRAVNDTLSVHTNPYLANGKMASSRLGQPPLPRARPHRKALGLSSLIGLQVSRCISSGQTASPQTRCMSRYRAPHISRTSTSDMEGAWCWRRERPSAPGRG